MFDRLPETSDTTQLTFQKDDILYIDNTMYNGEPGHWSAWLLDNNGVKSRWGVIPSKYQVQLFLSFKFNKTFLFLVLCDIFLGWGGASDEKKSRVRLGLYRRF